MTQIRRSLVTYWELAILKHQESKSKTCYLKKEKVKIHRKMRR